LNQLAALALAGSMIVAQPGCGSSHASHGSHEVQARHGTQAQTSQEPHASERSRPTNQAAVLTVWAGAEKLASTAQFYEVVLGLRRVGSSTAPYILDADGTFIAIMEGQLEPPRDPARRWPMFALSVADLDQSVEQLRAADVELPWGVEEYGAPNPSSRYVMFSDPAGNLIELVQWL
jgi:catechol 2,3-dioxygenase-like lactoylglutathione lyase family enzyme